MSDTRYWKLNKGPWSSELDEKMWVDEATGHTVEILRHVDYGHLCGYVYLPEGHPAYGKFDSYQNYPEDINCHGGITFAREIPQKKPGFWCIGFDCDHGCDYAPYRRQSDYEQTYRDWDYVESQVRELAAQLKAMGIRP